MPHVALENDGTFADKSTNRIAESCVYSQEATMTLVIGGTRGTGLLIVRLLSSKSAPVRVLARNPSDAARRLPPGVEMIEGDMTKEETLAAAIGGTSHIVLTAGVRSGYPATETLVRSTEYNGVLNVLAAVRRTGFTGRLLYMTSSGVTIPSISATLLNLYKGNTLKWRRQSEQHIRASGIDYTVIRAGVLLNREGRRHGVNVVQEALPLSWRYRIARADVADAFVVSLNHPRTSRATFDIVWGRESPGADWHARLDRVRSDAQLVHVV
jgi:uncharacterized protein YbjT (DUF2867 family)